MDKPSLRGRSRNSHGTVAAINALHLNESSLLIGLITKADEAVATGLARHGIRHDLGGLARGEAALEKGDQNELVDLGAEVADKNAVLRSAIITVSAIRLGTERIWDEGAYRRSTKPPPEAQFSLNTRDELGTGVPVKLRAF